MSVRALIKLLRCRDFGWRACRLAFALVVTMTVSACGATSASAPATISSERSEASAQTHLTVACVSLEPGAIRFAAPEVPLEGELSVEEAARITIRAALRCGETVFAVFELGPTEGEVAEDHAEDRVAEDAYPEERDDMFLETSCAEPTSVGVLVATDGVMKRAVFVVDAACPDPYATQATGAPASYIGRFDVFDIDKDGRLEIDLSLTWEGENVASLGPPTLSRTMVLRDDLTPQLELDSREQGASDMNQSSFSLSDENGDQYPAIIIRRLQQLDPCDEALSVAAGLKDAVSLAREADLRDPSLLQISETTAMYSVAEDRWVKGLTRVRRYPCESGP